MDHSQPHQAEPHPGRGKWVLIGFLLVAAFFLWTEHHAHVLGVLPYLLVLACPLMHLFMHGGHGHHGHGGEGHQHSGSEPIERGAGEKS